MFGLDFFGSIGLISSYLTICIAFGFGIDYLLQKFRDKKPNGFYINRRNNKKFDLLLEIPGVNGIMGFLFYTVGLVLFPLLITLWYLSNKRTKATDRCYSVHTKSSTIIDMHNKMFLENVYATEKEKEIALSIVDEPERVEYINFEYCNCNKEKVLALSSVLKSYKECEKGKEVCLYMTNPNGVVDRYWCEAICKKNNPHRDLL